MQTDTGTTHRPHHAHGVATPRIRFHLDMASVWAEEVWLAPRPGIRIRELYQSDDGYRISLVRYAPGAKVPEHLHAADEHTYVIEGSPGNYKSALVRFRPGAFIPLHVHMGDEHGYILSGCCEDDYGSYETGGYAYNPIGTSHRLWSEEGCLALVHWRGPTRYL